MLPGVEKNATVHKLLEAKNIPYMKGHSQRQNRRLLSTLVVVQLFIACTASYEPVEKAADFEPFIPVVPGEIAQQRADSLVQLMSFEEKVEFVKGYRWYERKKVTPLFPFGHGLSYTSFQYSDLKLKELPGDKVEVSLRVSNTGDKKGKETIQLYVSDFKSSVPRPLKELKGFKKMELAVGEEKRVSFLLLKKDFSFWDPGKRSWFFEKGDFNILVGSSSADIRLTGRISPGF